MNVLCIRIVLQHIMAKRGRFTVPTLEDISKEEEIHPLDRPLIFKNTANVEGVLEPNNLSDSGSKSQSKGDYPSLEGIHQRSHQGITDPQSSIDMKITSSGGSLRSQAITVHPVQVLHATTLQMILQCFSHPRRDLLLYCVAQ
jgi:hypothetical protein